MQANCNLYSEIKVCFIIYCNWLTLVTQGKILFVAFANAFHIILVYIIYHIQVVSISEIWQLFQEELHHVDCNNFNMENMQIFESYSPYYPPLSDYIVVIYFGVSCMSIVITVSNKFLPIGAWDLAVDLHPLHTVVEMAGRLRRSNIKIGLPLFGFWFSRILF